MQPGNVKGPEIKKASYWILIFVLCLFMTIVPNRTYANIYENGNYNDEFIANQSKSLKTYFDIKEDLFLLDSYGGCYIDAAGNLNIWYKDQLDTIKEIADAHKDSNQAIYYRKADYSFNKLQEINDILFDSFNELGIEALSIDEYTNRVQIFITEGFTAKEKISTLIDDENAIYYEIIAEGPTKATIYTVYNGSGVSGSGNNFSVAVGAELNGEYGFITAGHCGSIGASVTYNGSALGWITARCYGGNADVAFIERSYSPNTFIATRQFIDGTSYTGGTLDYVSGGFPVGTAITKYGLTTGTTSGTILSTNYSFSYPDGTSFSKMVSATSNCEDGDSGGSIKVTYNAGGLLYTYCAGVVSGKYSTLFGAKRTIYTDMTKAKSALGFSGYSD